MLKYMKNNYKKIFLYVGLVLLLGGCAREEKQPMGAPYPLPMVSEAPEETFAAAKDASGEDVGLNSGTTVTPLPTATATPTPTPTPKPSVTLTMTGDILLHDRIHKYCLQEDGTYNYDAIFANMAERIAGADLALVNQEIILGGKELGISGYPSFNAPVEVGDALVNAGFDVVLHGTNHALDKHGKGVTNTLAFWEETYPQIGVLGIHDSVEDKEEIYVAEAEGIRIAILNYTYGTNGIKMPEDMPFAVDMLEEETVIRDIARAKELADFVIVCPHWGTEYKLTPDSRQEKWTKLFLEQGVDAVIGTHPHVIQPVEWLTNEETGEKMLVFYSLGNFVNWTSDFGDGIANRMVGAMANIALERNEAGEVFVADYGVDAVVSHVEKKTNGVTVYPLSVYTEELAEQNAIRNQDENFSLEYCVSLCDDIFGQLWK